MIDTKLKRQNYAFSCINQLSSNTYKAKIENFGLVIYKNGLISALLMANNKEIELYKHITKWLIQDPIINLENNNVIMQKLVELTPIELMAITEESLLLSDALKEFTKAKDALTTNSTNDE